MKKKIKSLLELTGLVSCVLAPSYCAGQKATAKNPNIIYILADDLGYGELGCYGQTKIKTPNLDRMAANGIRFTQNYSGSSVSGPSRSCLFTGQHAGYAWTRDNSPIDDPLPASSITFAKALKNLGYATGAFGKWGGGDATTSGAPWLQGFDTFFGYLTHDPAHNYYPDNLYSNNTIVALNNRGISAHPTTVVSPANDSTQYLKYIGNEWSNTRIKEEAVKFINKNKDQKFLAYMPFTVPHLALQAPLDSLDKYYGKGYPKGRAFAETPYPGGGNYTPAYKPRAMYATMITLLDVYVGQIEAELKALNLDTCTLIMFSSDNGATNSTGGSDTPFFNSTGGLRGTKYTWYEGGIRVPLIAYWPGHVPAGVTSNVITHIEDILPTIVEVAGGAPSTVTTGISLVPTILPNGTKQTNHKFLYWENATGSDALQAVRSGKWKLHRQKIRTGEKYELYNLETDERETSNVATQFPDTVAKLKKFMDDRVDGHIPSWNFLTPSQIPVVTPPTTGIAANNNALVFNGSSDWIELTGYKGIGGSNPRTVEAWVKTTATSPGEIIGWGANSSGNKWAIRVENASPNVGRLRVEGGGSWIIGTKILNDGLWHHIAVSYSGGMLSTTKLYVDGQTDAISSSSDLAINTSTTGGMDVQISKGFSTRYWTGEIDEIRIWNTARSASEIANNFNCPISNPATSAGLVCYFDCNRDQANILPDLKATANGKMNMAITSWKASGAGSCSAAGIEGIISTPSARIHPSLNHGSFNIQSNANSENPVSLEVFDSFGKCVYVKNGIIQPNQKIKLKETSKGVFFVQIKTNKQTFTEKIVVMN